MFKKILFTFFIILIILIFYSNNVFAADPKLISKLDSAFQKIENWLIKLATPAAAVAVGTGIFMKKFSFGDEERIRTGKKIIRSSLFSYAFILAIDLILSAIKSLIWQIGVDKLQTDYTQTIIDTINKIFSMLFSSLDLSIYSLLDKTVFINSSIVNDRFFSLAFNSSFGLSIIANALLAGFFIYYCFKLYLAPFSGSYVEKPYQFLTKVLIIAICISFSQFLCSEFLSIIDILTDILKSFGMQLTGKEISFNTLLSSSTYVIENSNNFNFFSFDGILKSFFSFGLINLLFSYSIRYILIKILILLFPFALLSLVTTSTSWIFKSWFRTFFSLIFVQIFIIFVLILLFSLNINTSDMFSQISYISTVFILTKSNSYIRELLGGISTDLNYNILNFKNLFK